METELDIAIVPSSDMEMNNYDGTHLSRIPELDVLSEKVPFVLRKVPSSVITNGREETEQMIPSWQMENLEKRIWNLLVCIKWKLNIEFRPKKISIYN